MLTLAEELGLSGLNLNSRVRQAFFQVPEDEALRLVERIRLESARRHLFYLRDGQRETIPVLPCPLVALPDQLAYIHVVTQTIHNALKRLPEMYFQDVSVREVLRIPADEEEWLWQCWSPAHREHNPVFGRLDALVDFTSPTWKTSLSFVEPNMSGIGGLHLVPTAERIISDVVVPVIQAKDPQLRLELAPDIRELLMQDLRDHLEALGRPGRNICFVEPKYAASGPDEQAALASYFHEQYGMKSLHADPTEMELRGGEVYYGGEIVDLVYRDYNVADLLHLKAEGDDVSAMRELFRQNRVVSSIAAELDQKACWEVLTDARFTDPYFSADERQIFRRHVLWTRVLSDRKTLFPDGRIGDLLEYARRERETLVLKPNRAYGGEGVQIGPSLTQSEWESA